jgi:hypothetical protein
MGLLKRIFAAVLNLAEEVAESVVKDVKATFNGMRMDREEAKRRGRNKLVAYAKAEGFPNFDANSVNDTFKLIQRMMPHDWVGSVDDMKRRLAEEMGIVAYAMSAEQNDKLRTELQIMIGYGDISL